MSRPAAGGGRWVEVDPERLGRWLSGFVERHGEVQTRPLADGLEMRAADGEVAECHLLTGSATDLDELVAEALRPRRLGLLLVRRGGFGVGVAAGTDLITSKVGSRYVQSRTAAGGWSQQRFARRRDNQARAAAGETADVVARLLVPAVGDLDAVVTGGDRRLVDEVLADARLAALRPLRAGRFLDVPDPKLTVLKAAVTAARSVRIRLSEGPGQRGGPGPAGATDSAYGGQA
ncbi:acVLRF1 family peptidyl-tRNA hydrolase [Planosporangium sp. 12N6]|uniref:acVLRF1 family peptidyl-tRNA hydrolase n=1 Tax=Planosporangium spinosum TaxID=3402278 RepID=UPI003CF23CDC